MSAKKVQRATLGEILAFVKSKGVELSDDAIDHLRKKLEEEPVSKPTLKKSKFLSSNPLAKQVIELMMVKRAGRIKEIAENNPLLKMIEDKRSEMGAQSTPRELPMSPALRRIFHDDTKWQPYQIFLGLPAKGRIVKVVEDIYKDMPYIGFLKVEAGKTQLYSTRRIMDADDLENVKYFRLKEGVFQYEIDEIDQYEKGYLEYIMHFHKT
ncbi:MAG: hypothetical protein GY863_06090 [bacterium]|nr:hypothetical protein [bacterium]